MRIYWGQRFCRAIGAVLTVVLAVAAQAQETTRHKESVETFFSKALDAVTTVTVYAPEPMVKGKRYPVVYMLHGFGGNNRSWVEQTSMSLALAGRDVIAVMPDGAYGGWYIDSPRLKNHNYETLIANDVIEFVDKKYPTVARREGRALGGLSMGGHGAMTLAAKHPDKWCAVSSFSGTLNLFHFPDHQYLTNIMGALPEAAAVWQHNSAVQLVDCFTTAGLAIQFDCGRDDVYVPSSRQMHEILFNRGVPHTYKEFKGVHAWWYWADHLPEYVAWLCDSMDLAQNNPKRFKEMTRIESRGKAGKILCKQEADTRRLIAANTSNTIVLIGAGFAGFDAAKELLGVAVVNRGSTFDALAVPDEGNDTVGFGLINRLDYSVLPLRPKTTVIYADGYVPNGAEENALDTYRKVVDRLLAADGTGNSRVVAVTPVAKAAREVSFVTRFNKDLRQLVNDMNTTRVVLADYAADNTEADGFFRAEPKPVGEFLRPILLEQ